MKSIITCPVCNTSSLSAFKKCIDHSVSRESFSLKKCSSCQLLITDPQPENEQLEKYYQFTDYISHTSKGNNLINRVYLLARHYTLRQKLNLIQKYSSTGRILDVGCGTGNFLHFCKQHGWSAHGIEPSNSARTIAAKKELNVNATFLQTTESEFDVITLWHVLEHLPNLNEDLELIKNKLKHNGIIFIAVPNYQSYDASYYRQLWAAYDVPRHLWHFTKETMQQLLKKHGLNLININPLKLDAYYVSLLSEKHAAENNMSLLGMANALRIGLISNLKAKSNVNHSSLIYIAKK